MPIGRLVSMMQTTRQSMQDTRDRTPLTLPSIMVTNHRRVPEQLTLAHGQAVVNPIGAIAVGDLRHRRPRRQALAVGVPATEAGTGKEVVDKQGHHPRRRCGLFTTRLSKGNTLAGVADCFAGAVS